MSSSIYDIKEDEIQIEGKPWDDSEVQRLVYKQIYLHKKCYEYWEHLLKRGRRLFKYFDGKILTDYQREEYKLNDKIILEPPIMKSPILALVGHLMKSRKSGQVITEGGSLDEPYSTPEEITTVNIGLKNLEIRTREKFKLRDMAYEACVACYPTALCYEKKRPTFDNPLKGKLIHPSWDSCVFGPSTMREPDGIDMTDLFWFEPRTQSDLEDNFPEMVKQIRAHWKSNGKIDSKQISSVMQWEGDNTSADRDYLWSVIDNARSSMNSPTGMLQVVQRLFPIKRKEEIWVNSDDETGEDFEIRPPDWKDSRWEEWKKDNPKYEGPYEREIIVLWRTVFTLSGLMLASEKHWFQENGKIPAVLYIPSMVSGMPSGPAADLEADCLRNCVAKIEELDDIRKNGGTLLQIQEGAIKNAGNITEEYSKSVGVVVVSKDYKGAQPAIAPVQRQVSQVWGQYANSAKQDMYDNSRLSETLQGEAAPRQAAIAKNIEIAQSLTVWAMVIDNFNLTWESLQNLKCALIPYFYDEHEIIECFDEEKKLNLKQEINQPQFDIQGNKENVVNDLTAHKYRWHINPVDDSPTAKTRMMEDAILIINGAAGPLMQKDPSGKIFANFLMAFQNEWLNKAGKAIMEDTKQQAESQSAQQKEESMRDAMIEMEKAKVELLRAQKAGININFSGKDLAQYPKLLEVYTQLQTMFGALQPQGTQQPAPQIPQAPMAAQPGAMPAVQPEMAIAKP